MLDTSHIPYNQQNTQIFYAISGSIAANPWQTWQKPRNAKMIQIMCVGGGGGGATGKFFLGGGQVTNGGSGGGGGVVTTALYPASILPDTLYVQAGIGGRGGVGGLGITTQQGVAGGTSYISVTPTASAAALVCIAPGGGAGVVAANSSNAANTTNAAAQTTTNATFMSLAIYKSTAGTPGGTGFASSTGGSVTALGTSLTCGGSGGGGTTTTVASGAGTVITASIYLTAQLPTPLGTSGSKPSPSSDGYGQLLPFYCGVGGVGSGGSTNSVSGNAGKGYYGCGGGGTGGSAGASGAGGVGTAGNGGDGLVIITTIT